jgi:hypothetical protein
MHGSHEQDGFGTSFNRWIATGNAAAAASENPTALQVTDFIGSPP